MAYAPKSSVEQWRGSVAELAGGYPVSYLLGLMDRLSGGNDQFEGRLGGRGLYQIHPNTADALDLDPAALWDPDTNIAIAVRLLKERSSEIQGKDPSMAAERPGDLGLLTTASYLWGPGTILPLISAGVTAGEVFAELDPKVGEFAVDVFNRALAYRTDLAPSNGEPEPKPSAEKPSPLGPLLWVLGLSGVALGAFFLVRKER